ncbi:apolipoprotein D-like isoform X2 [Odontomachus brunneus]|uniref:apolipoprotein D-like isoform X2 n=1 Tax=Odontomachus brunneus TaxID=486640 RepID=UPI0013F24A70|nr:apolipoprotein D-like isoform X2 [Odontomachus brunneus]
MISFREVNSESRSSDRVSYKMQSLTWYLALATCIAFAQGHTYHMGSCPIVEPMQGFQMNRFLGIWYVVQKTSTASKCITYNYTRGEEPGEYFITQDSDHPILGLTSLKHEYHYTGELSVPEPSTPGRMEVRFPLSVAGSASHVVFMTDYDNYAGIFTCQKLAFAHRQSATILSRTRMLDQAQVDKIRHRLSQYGVDPFDLSIISQTDCPRGNNSLDINVDPNTFTSENIGNVVRKAGEKLGDGVQWISQTGSHVYHKLTGTEESDHTSSTSHENSEVTANVRRTGGKYETNEVEWIP